MRANANGGKAEPEKINAVIQSLVVRRAEARKAKNFALGDQIRKGLSELGVMLEDRLGETVWRME